MKLDKLVKGYYSNKRYVCFFCEKVMLNMVRYLLLKYYEEVEVVKIFILFKKSKERRRLWEEIVNKGNFYYNYFVIEKGKGIIIFKYRKDDKFKVDVKDYVLCYYCKGFYKWIEFWKYIVFCGGKFKEFKLYIWNYVKFGWLLFFILCNNV